MMESLDRLRLTSPTDRYFNYCQWEYQPQGSPAGKLRSVNLLWQSLKLMGLGDQAVQLVALLQKDLGDFRTVWGIKHSSAGLQCEFYFYDYKRRQRDISVTRVLRAIQPLVTLDLAINENIPYFMFSIDIDAPLLCRDRPLDLVHLYVGNPGSLISSGTSYAVQRDSITLENFYFFFDVQKQLNEAAGKIACSPHFDAMRWSIDQVLWPQLRKCRTICVANKRHCDTAYFAGINVDQLLMFLGAMRYPPALIDFVQRHRDAFDHMLYDVGFDYVAGTDGPMFVKTGFYGSF